MLYISYYFNKISYTLLQTFHCVGDFKISLMRGSSLTSDRLPHNQLGDREGLTLISHVTLITVNKDENYLFYRHQLQTGEEGHTGVKCVIKTGDKSNMTWHVQKCHALLEGILLYLKWVPSLKMESVGIRLPASESQKIFRMKKCTSTANNEEGMHVVMALKDQLGEKGRALCEKGRALLDQILVKDKSSGSGTTADNETSESETPETSSQTTCIATESHSEKMVEQVKEELGTGADKKQNKKRKNVYKR